MPHMPSPHHAVPRRRLIPDGPTPRAPSHLGTPRINNPKIKYPARRVPITTACASTLCSRHHFIRLFLANFATLNASVIFASQFSSRSFGEPVAPRLFKEHFSSAMQSGRRDTQHVGLCSGKAGKNCRSCQELWPRAVRR